MKPLFVEFADLVVAVVAGVVAVLVLAEVVLVVGALVFELVVVLAFEVVLLCASVRVEAIRVNKQTATKRGSNFATLLFTVSDSLRNRRLRSLSGKQDAGGYARGSPSAIELARKQLPCG